MRFFADSSVTLSIVVAAWNDASSLQECLRSLSRQIEPADTEIIVVSNYSRKHTEMLEKQFPQIRQVNLPETATVPELRAEGIYQSKGAIVALLEDHSFLCENWCAEIKKGHDLPYSIVGGSVDNASRERLIDWAVYFYDYGKYMSPNQAGVVDSLSGNNVSYKRAALAQVESCFRNGFYETFIHGELRRQGHPLYMAPAAVVYHKKHYGAKQALIDCYHHGRLFSGKRVGEASRLQRGALTIGSLVLPILLPARIALRIIQKKRHIKELLLSLPHLLLLMTSWSVGEFCGYAFGAGASSSKWR
jgi:GT2 family glycosyltransferase